MNVEKNQMPTIGQAIENALKSLQGDINPAVALSTRIKAVVNTGRHLANLQAVAHKRAMQICWDELSPNARESYEQHAMRTVL